MNISELPNEILGKIFSFLEWKDLQKVATLTCKAWLKTIREDITLSCYLVLKKKVPREIVEGILRRWPKLKCLHLKRLKHPSPDCYRPTMADFENSKHLTWIVFDGEKYEGVFKNKTILSTEYFYINLRNMSQGIVYPVDLRMKALLDEDKVDIKHEGSLVFSFLQYFTAEYPIEEKITDFRVAFSKILRVICHQKSSPWSLQIQFDEARFYFLRKNEVECQSLTQLVQDLSKHNPSIDDITLIAPAVVDCCHDEEDCNFFAPLVMTLSHLTSINLHGILVKDCFFDNIAINEKIIAIKLESCLIESDDVWPQLARYFPCLENLILDNCIDEDDECWILMEVLEALPRFRKLKFFEHPEGAFIGMVDWNGKTAFLNYKEKGIRSLLDNINEECQAKVIFENRCRNTSPFLAIRFDKEPHQRTTYNIELNKSLV